MSQRPLSRIEIVNPFLGQEWIETTRSGRRVSTTEEGLILIRAAFNRMLDPESVPLSEFISRGVRMRRLGFASVSRLADSAGSRWPREIELQEEYGSAMGYFQTDADAVRRVIAVRDMLTFETFVVGSCSSPFTKPVGLWKTYPWDIDYFLDEVELIACVARFDYDAGTVEVLTRPFPSWEERAAALAAI